MTRAAGLRCLPAGNAGLARLSGHTGSRAGSRPDSGRPAIRSLPADLGNRIRVLLGDALPWARRVALPMPPVGWGLVEALRRHWPGLPAEARARLLALPGSSAVPGGLIMSPAVRTWFKHDLARSQAPQVLRVQVAEILDLYEQERPKDSDSLDHWLSLGRSCS
jgi:hypothetical protein